MGLGSLSFSDDTRVGSRFSREKSSFVSFDFPRRVVRDIHRKITARTSQCGHGYAREWLATGDPFVLAGSARDDVSATIHLRLRLIEVAGIKGRENLVTVASANTQAPSMYFLSPDETFSATHRADILSSIFSPFMFWVVPTASN